MIRRALAARRILAAVSKTPKVITGPVQPGYADLPDDERLCGHAGCDAPGGRRRLTQAGPRRARPVSVTYLTISPPRAARLPSTSGLGWPQDAHPK